MIKQCDINQIEQVAYLAQTIYRQHSVEDLCHIFKKCISRSDSHLIVKEIAGVVVGFAQFELRHEYVEGVKQSPCVYLEGITVDQNFRQKGFAKELVKAGEIWGKELNCTEFASDCELENIESYLFHQSIGFKEVSRSIHFVKKLN